MFTRIEQMHAHNMCVHFYLENDLRKFYSEHSILHLSKRAGREEKITYQLEYAQLNKNSKRSHMVSLDQNATNKSKCNSNLPDVLTPLF